MCAPFVVSLPNIWWCGAWPTETVEKAFDCLSPGTKRHPRRKRPAAAHELSTEREQFARLRAEKCFRPRTCRGRKQITIFSRLRARTLRGFCAPAGVKFCEAFEGGLL